MKKVRTIAILCCVGLVLAACSRAASAGQAAGSGDPAALAALSFEQIVEQARGSTVNFTMWGGSDAVNSYIDGFVTARMRELYSIRVQRNPMDAPVFVNRLHTEKRAGRNPGSFDVLWINGENFRAARENELLFGPFLELLPNFREYGEPSLAEFDAGFPVDGYEAPWGLAQFNFDYDSARVADPPRSFAELANWVRRNPGRFTYPQPPDFTGSAFIRHVFYELSGGVEQYLEGFDLELYEAARESAFAYLRDIEPYLWQQGRSYPRDLAALDTLFERGEVDFTMSFTQTNAATRIRNGRYPDTVRSLVFEGASVANTHFLAIAFNAPNPAGALVLINFLLSPEAQYRKKLPDVWGDFTVLSMERLSPEDRRRFEGIDLGEATVSLAELERNAIPEAPSEYWEALEEDWFRFVRDH